MTEELREFLKNHSQGIDDAVREAVELCGGSPLKPLYTALIANRFLSEDNERLREENAGLQRNRPKG